MKNQKVLMHFLIAFGVFYTSIFFLSSTSHAQQNQLKSKHISIPSQTISVNEKISISYFGLPGNKQDWITIVPVDKPDNTYGQWFYTQGKTNGKHTFNAIQEAGVYEIRTYYNWPDGKFEVKDRLKVYITEGLSLGSSGYFKFNKSGYNSNQPIEIEFLNLPGNKQDWITLVEAHKLDDTYGQWFYTGGKMNGSHTFRAVSPGKYELRLYFNWPDGKFEVKAREIIIVK